MPNTKSLLDDWPESSDAKRKSLLVAYLLWFFLWWAGAHHLYLRRYGSALGYALLSLVGANLDMPLALIFLIVPVWWTIDLFLLPGLVRTTPARARKDSPAARLSQRAVVQDRRPMPVAPSVTTAPLRRSATFGQRR
ncbi:TM2 domain-containing protein [Tianweitania sp.]|uniref:TM2 domain-containing protein n=1 Tax=Tianweitania sp. TaxID=2021634 RepID=UPI00289C84A1|nr:TM2 domain-containing protein [Tianweitania sp.]